MAKEKQTQIRVWDLPLRLFHWLLTVSIICSWYTVEIMEDMQLHFYSGYAILTLLLFRLCWGFFGSYYSRFARLLQPPRAIITYIRTLFSNNPQRFAGHNPLGSLAVIAMLLVLGAQVATGLLSSDDYYYGPLAGLVDSDTIKWLSGLHQQNFELIKIVIAIHLIAILLYRLLKKEELTAAMINGRKNSSKLTKHPKNKISNRLWLAILFLMLSAATTYVVVTMIAEPVEFTDTYY